ncbi:hypothetical protein Bca4012_064218 [Brassica carinata]
MVVERGLRGKEERWRRWNGFDRDSTSISTAAERTEEHRRRGTEERRQIWNKGMATEMCVGA